MVCHLLGSVLLNFDRYLTIFTFILFNLPNFSSDQPISCPGDPAVSQSSLTLILLTWSIGWAPSNASKWQIGFNSAFKGLISRTFIHLFIYLQQPTVDQVKVKITLVQSMKTQRGSRGIALLSFNLGARCEWVVNATPRPLDSGKERNIGGWKPQGRSRQV